MQKKGQQINSECQKDDVQEQQSYEDSSDSEELRQPAFPLQINSSCQEGEKEAFQYLLQVRQQAGQIKQKKSNNIIVPMIQQQIVPQPLQETNSQVAQWFEKWEKQVLEHWKCIIANIKYLITQKQQTKYPQKKINTKSKPKIKELVHRLVLPQIQNLIVEMCQDYLQSDEHSSQNKYLFYLWIFSLLAMHQSRAQYTMFEALASINSCLIGESQSTPQMLSVYILLKEHFSQHHLAKTIKTH